jgi:hypothetical protein
VNLADIQRQVPLPETADELCAVAEGVKAEPRDIHLGARATEGLQHGRGWGDERRGAVGPGAGLHLRRGTVPAGVALGGLLRRDGEADHERRG